MHNHFVQACTNSAAETKRKLCQRFEKLWLHWRWLASLAQSVLALRVKFSLVIRIQYTNLKTLKHALWITGFILLYATYLNSTRVNFNSVSICIPTTQEAGSWYTAVPELFIHFLAWMVPHWFRAHIETLSDDLNKIHICYGEPVSEIGQSFRGIPLPSRSVSGIQTHFINQRFLVRYRVCMNFNGKRSHTQKCLASIITHVKTKRWLHTCTI